MIPFQFQREHITLEDLRVLLKLFIEKLFSSSLQKTQTKSSNKEKAT